MLKAAKAWGPDAVISLGDFCDFYSVSSHSKDPMRGICLEEEANMCFELLEKIRALGAKEHIFVCGNHEDRFDRYIRDQAPALHGITSISKLLDLKGSGWKVINYRDFITIGKVLFTHDLDYTGAYVAQRSLACAQKNVVVGHCHRISYAVQGDALGRSKVGVSFGWLGDTDAADYMHRLKAKQDWSHGFGLGYLDEKSGVMFLVPVPIITYKGERSCLIEGKKFSL
jgi:predicted phosphodiesterase